MADLEWVETARLILRAPTAGDLDVVFEIHADPATNRFNPAGPSKSKEQARQTLDRWLEHWRIHGFGYWLVESKERPGSVVGCGGLMLRKILGDEEPNLYFRFRPSAWGMGFAGEMARAACGVAFECLEFDRIVATVRPANAPSIRVLQKIGMEPGGEVQDDRGPSLFYVLARS